MEGTREPGKTLEARPVGILAIVLLHIYINHGCFNERGWVFFKYPIVVKYEFYRELVSSNISFERANVINWPILRLALEAKGAGTHVNFGSLGYYKTLASALMKRSVFIKRGQFINTPDVT